jgi:hypothetical protein
MTEVNVKQRLTMFCATHCLHGDIPHIWCNRDTCWEFDGLTSRFTEGHMLNKNFDPGMFLPMLHDKNDFCGFHTGIMTKHPEWKARLPEMAKYGRQWQRLIKYYDELEKYFTEGRMEALSELINAIDKNNNRLYSYVLPNDMENCTLKEYLIVGSMIPRDAYDEFDICHCCVTNKLPTDSKFDNIRCTIYDDKGNYKGSRSCELFHPDKLEVVSDIQRVKDASDNEDAFVKQFNEDEDKKKYEDKMIELVRRYRNKEIILESELPTDKDHGKTDIQYCMKYGEEIKKLLEKLSEFINFPDDFTIENISPFTKYYSDITNLLHNIKMFNRYNENLNLQIEHVELIESIELFIKLVMEVYNGSYVNEISMHKEFEALMLSSCETFSNVCYHYCPHYILYDEKHKDYDGDFELYSAEITTIDDFEKEPKDIDDLTLPTIELVNDDTGIKTCLISITKDHFLYPGEDDFEKEYNGMIWTVSSNAIEKCVVYEEGLMNA